MALGESPLHSQPAIDSSPAGRLRASSVEALEDEIITLSAHLTAATYRWLELIAEFDRREGWGGWGMRSCAHWLSWKCGLSEAAAREKVRVARALESFPEIADAMRRGVVSYSKVRAMIRVASAANERALLAIALNGTATHVEQVARAYRRSERPIDRDVATAQHRNRELTHYWDEDGYFVIKGRLPPEQGAIVAKALQAADEALRKDESPDPIPASDDSAESPDADPEARRAAPKRAAQPAAQPTWTERQADALALLAETLLAHGPQGLSAGDRHLVSVHVNIHALAGTVLAGTQNDDVADHQCHLHDGPALARDVVRRFACDASVVALLENERGEVLDVGRKTRAIPPALRRALDHRDHGCRFPGCSCTRFVDAHHIEHWADGGATRIDNLVLLCRHHHRLVHEGGFALEMRGGEVSVRRPDGRVLERVVRAAELRGAGEDVIRREHEMSGVEIDARTGIPGWGGERADYDYLVAMLADRDRPLPISQR